jgi:hypothetical protein
MRLRRIACLLTLGTTMLTALALASTASAWTVSMTAQPKVKRTYGWSIQKSVDRPAVTLEAGKTTDVTYSVTVGGTGSVDSDWSVAGTVEMGDDPNVAVQWVRVTINPEGTLATVDCLPYTFPVELGLAGLKCTYAASLPDGNGTRDAWMRAQQVNGNFRNVHTPFDFSSPALDEVNECVQVTDTMAGALGTVCAADAPKTFTYTKTIGPFAKSQCGSQVVANTASYVAGDTGATGAADANVAVTVTCPPPPPPPPSKPDCKDREHDHGKGDHGKDKDRDDHDKWNDRDKDRGGHDKWDDRDRDRDDHKGRDDDKRGGSSKGRDDDRGRGRR